MLRIRNFFLFILISAFLLRCTFDKQAPTQPGNNQTTKTIPHSPQPGNNVIDQPLVLSLDWIADTSVKFNVYLDKQNPPQNALAIDAVSKPIITNSLEYGTTYYWKVTVKYSDGSNVDGPIWRFTTINDTTSSTENGYVLFMDSIQTSPPCIVNAMFHVKELNGKGVTNLTIDNFEVLEDSQPLTLSESLLQIKKYDAVPYTIKTVLMLDNSTSLQNDINKIRDAAILFVNNLMPNQEAAVFKFSEEIEMLADFTSDKNTLNSVLQQYTLGSASTNLYGAVKKGASLWEDIFSITEIVQGSMIVFTDGNDTQGSTSLAEAINAVRGKTVFTIGLGSEIQPEILEEIGTAGYYPISDVNQLTEKFNIIQQNINDYANSFYFLSYQSPKRGNNDHIITIKIKNNPHTGDNSFITGTFNSGGFTSAKKNLFQHE